MKIQCMENSYDLSLHFMYIYQHAKNTTCSPIITMTVFAKIQTTDMPYVTWELRSQQCACWWPCSIYQSSDDQVGTTCLLLYKEFPLDGLKNIASIYLQSLLYPLHWNQCCYYMHMSHIIYGEGISGIGLVSYIFITHRITLPFLDRITTMVP